MRKLLHCTEHNFDFNSYTGIGLLNIQVKTVFGKEPFLFSTTIEHHYLQVHAAC